MDKILKKMAEMYLTFQFVIMIACTIFIFAQIMVSWVFLIILEAISILGLIFCKDYTEKPHKTFFVFRISTIFIVIALLDILIKGFEGWIKVDIPMFIKGMFYFTVIFTCGYLLFNKNEEKLKFLDEIKVKEKIGGKGTDAEESDYDVIICKEKETEKPVIILGADRFVHLLGIGPTGSGKTSQVIIRMIEQDVKKGHGLIVIEPKGDLAGKVYAMGVYYKQPVIYFNPIFPDCPYINPLDGEEDKVIETMTTVFIMLTPDSKTYFKDITNDLIGNAILVLKRLEKAYTNPLTGISERPATLITLSDILHNANNKGREMVNELCRIPTLTDAEKKQNEDVRDWFLNEYFADRSKIYENTGGVRTQVSKLIRNKYLRRVMNPPDGKTQINFDEIIEKGQRLVITTAQGDLRELGSYLGYFIIFNLQAAIFRRPGTEFDRLPCFLYIDEFQKYANAGFEDILTQGRSYRVSANLFTQSRKMIEENTDRGFAAVIDSNCRNVIAFPGISTEDAKYFEDLFGETETVEVQKGISKQKFSLAYGFKDMNYPTLSERYVEKTESRYSKTDIRFKPFGEITYMIISDKSLTAPGNGVADFLNKKLNAKFDKIEQDYTKKQKDLNEQREREIEDENRKLYAEFMGLKRKSPDSGKNTPNVEFNSNSNNSYKRNARRTTSAKEDSRLSGNTFTVEDMVNDGVGRNLYDIPPEMDDAEPLEDYEGEDFSYTFDGKINIEKT